MIKVGGIQMGLSNNKNTILVVGQQLRDSQGAVGVVEKIVQEFIFVRFPTGVRRMRCSAVGRDLFVVEPPREIVKESGTVPPIPLSVEAKRHLQKLRSTDEPKLAMPKQNEEIPKQEKQKPRAEIEEKLRAKKTEEVADKEEFISGSTPLLVRKGANWVPAVFLRFELKAGKKVIYVKCGAEVSFYAYPSRFVRKSNDTSPKEVFAYSDLSDVSTVDIDIQRITNAYKRYPVSREATTDKQAELSLERQYHGRVSSALDEMHLQETKRIDKSMDMERQAYEEMREAYTEEREYGYDPFNQGFISSGLKREDAARISWSARRKMEEINEIRKKPYFARIDCGSSSDDIHTVYIGDTAIQGLVTDWRNKYIGNVFYYSGILKDAEGIFIALKRHITFEDQVLTRYVDEINSYTGMTLIPKEAKDEKYISDELLIQLLEESRSQQSVHDIIRSIQQNQYKMITSDLSKNVLVNGCAGSGKTMILYHRLSYIAYNERDKFMPDRVFAITPTELFGSVTDDLISKLQIDEINNAPYLQTIHNFINTYKKKRQLIDGEILNTLPATGVWERAYAQTMYSEYQEILDNCLKDRDGFKDWAFREMSSILDRYDCSPISLGNYQEKITRWLRSSDFEYGDGEKRKQYGSEVFTTNAWENFEKSITTAFAGAIEEALKKSDQEQREKEEEARKKKEKRENLLSKNMLMLRTVLSPTPIKSAEGKIRTAQHGFLGLLDTPKKFEKLLCLTYVRKHAAELERFLKGGKEGTVYFLLCQYAMAVLKDRYDISESNFDFEELYYVRALSKHFGPLSYEPTWVFVDEFQNYSLFELETLREVYPKAIFNFYGDFSQCIEEKGAKEPDIISSFDVNCYAINENYRNALEITQYINKRLGKSMYPIGIHGDVRETRFDDCRFERDGRTAVIVKEVSQSVLERLNYVLPRYAINVANKYNMSLDFDKVNLIAVRDVKGLEFETAYVVNENMDANEKYVAYTRALSKLIVIS